MYMLTAISSTVREKIIEDIDYELRTSEYPSLSCTNEVWTFLFDSRVFMETDRAYRKEFTGEKFWEFNATILMILLEILEDFPINDSHDWTYEEISFSLS